MECSVAIQKASSQIKVMVVNVLLKPSTIVRIHGRQPLVKFSI
jgi:hypothetical protein